MKLAEGGAGGWSERIIDHDEDGVGVTEDLPQCADRKLSQARDVAVSRLRHVVVLAR